LNNRSAATVDTVTAGVDWISATLGRDELESQTWVYDAIHALEKIAMLGNAYKRRSLLGYDGWECAGCFIGSNETTHYAQFAGKYANDAYRFLDHPKVHISRIDLQLTVQYSIELIKEGRYQYARAVHHNKGLLQHKQRKVNLYAGSDGGDTVYLGSPSSDVRGRCYNKARQSGEAVYERSWRYETVYRNEYACNVYRSVIDSGDAAATSIYQEVIAWWAKRGVIILGLELGGADVIAAPNPPRTDVQRKLRWIKNQVIPTIRKLAEAGYAVDVMEMIAEAISAVRNSQK
jgi:Replication initiation factor